MNKALKSIITIFMGVNFMIFPINLYAQDCSYTAQGSSNGNCYNVSFEFSCDDGLACSFSYGGCDYGDVIITWNSGTCSQ